MLSFWHDIGSNSIVSGRPRTISIDSFLKDCMFYQLAINIMLQAQCHLQCTVM